MPERVECGCCKKVRSRKRCYGYYVGLNGVQYVCMSCKTLPFIEVMHALDNGKIYVKGTAYETIAEMEKALNAGR